MFSHIGAFIFTIPFYIYDIKKSKKVSEFNSLINYRKRNKKNLNLWILLIVFLWIVEEYLFIFYTLILGGLEFWFVELLIICLMAKKIFHLEWYKHHKLALSINVVPLLIKFILTILSNKLENKTSNLIYIIYLWMIPLGIIIYLILAFLKSFIYIKIQKFLYYNLVSPYKILMIYGLMGGIITSIFCIITSNVNCDVGEVQDYFCNVSENNGSIKFIDSFPIYHNTFQEYSSEDKTQIILEILVIIFGFITFFINKYNFLLMIRIFGPVLYVFSFPILFLLRKLILIINTLIISKSIFIKDVMGINKLKFIFDMIGDILSLISFLIYSEIIELNFCGLYYDTAKNIKRKGIVWPFNPFFVYCTRFRLP